MDRTFVCGLALAAVAGSFSAAANGAYIVETRTGGKGFADFGFGGNTTTASTSTAGSAAVGTTAGLGSIFGGNGSPNDIYVYSFTPGTDADNATFTLGQPLGSTTGFPGEGNVSTGLAGGVSGTYRVYFTAPESTNVSTLGSDFTLTQDGSPVVLSDVNLNNGGTGADTDSGTAFVGGANNAWHLLGTVTLTAGNAYTVTQAAGDSSFVSQRAVAVMWEFVEPVPEPTSLALVGVGGIALLGRRRRI
jgi:hypothetical protein